MENTLFPQTAESTEPIPASPAPMQQKERILMLDALRGVAICGILIMNIHFFGRSFWADDLRVDNELNQPANVATWSLVNFMLEGSFRGLFSILFGAGSVLLISRLEKNNPGLKPADIYYRRLIWLLLFGLINGYVLNWPGDILYHYAIVGFFLFPFRKASYRLLLGLVIFFVGLTMLTSWVRVTGLKEMKAKGETAMALEKEKRPLNEQQKGDLEKWKEYLDEQDPKTMRKKAQKDTKEIGGGGYVTVWKNVTPWTTKLESSKFHGGFFYDVFIFFLLGIFLFRTGIISGEKPAMLYAILLVVGYTFGFGSGILEKNAVLKANFDRFRYMQYSFFPINVYQIHRIATTLGHMSLLVLLWKSGRFQWLLRPFTRMGQMAFTNYLLQSVLCGFIFYGYGLGYYGKFQRYQLWYFVAGVCAFEMLLSIVWLRYFRFGPLEWCWRSLTYWKPQPIRKVVPQTAFAPALS